MAKITLNPKSKTTKQRKTRPFEKLLLVLLSGNAVTKAEIATLLNWEEPRGSKVRGPKIYNISSYIWDIKNIPQVKGETLVVRSVRDGKKVTAYQLVSVDLAKEYLKKRGLYQGPVITAGDATVLDEFAEVVE